MKWLPLFTQTLYPINPEISENIPNLVDRLVLSLGCGSKGQQIFNISVFKSFMHHYICEEAQIEAYLIPKAKAFLG